MNFFNYKSRKYKRLETELEKWRTKFVEPGHYYSPFSDKGTIESKSDYIFNRDVETKLGGIEINTEAQFKLLEKLIQYYDPNIFPVESNPDSRYYFNNQFFSYSDAIFLTAMIREWKPERIVEIGSGFSSAVMLDINEKYMRNSIQLTFIEPFPEDRLNLLVKESDNYNTIKDIVQNTSLETFTSLEENDILFIDSSHVSKTYSDVNHLIFNIFPLLKKGVIIHIHDIFFPFEYPEEWVQQQRAWNEAYLMRAFLQFNDKFKIELFTSYLERKFRTWFASNMPLCLLGHEKWPAKDGSNYLLDTTGQSLYIRKVA